MKTLTQKEFNTFTEVTEQNEESPKFKGVFVQNVHVVEVSGSMGGFGSTASQAQGKL